MTRYQRISNAIYRRLEYISIPLRSNIQTIGVGKHILKITKQSPLRVDYKLIPWYQNFVGYIAAAVESVHPSSWVVDVGANVGDTTSWIKTHSDLPVLAIEGDTTIYPLLQQNAATMERVEPVCVYLSDKASSIQATIREQGFNSTIVENKSAAPGSTTIELKTLDSLLQERPHINIIKFIKVDAEGYDFRIIRGADTAIRRYNPALAFELNWPNVLELNESVSTFYDYLIELDYTNYLIFDRSGRYICHLKDPSQSDLVDLYSYTLENRGYLEFLNICAFHSSELQMLESAKAILRKHIDNI